MKQYLALLRGINVGGNNIIKMTDLKKCFEDLGFFDVATYIQSGNVVFNSHDEDFDDLSIKIEEKLSKAFNYQSLVVVVTYHELQKVVIEAPSGFGLKKEEYRYDVLFLKAPLVVKEVIKNIAQNNEVDRAYAGSSVFYFSRLIAKSDRSYLSKFVKHQDYKNITVRNWNTTTKLLQLMEK